LGVATQSSTGFSVTAANIGWLSALNEVYEIAPVVYSCSRFMEQTQAASSPERVNVSNPNRGGSI
jgi:hypothetical protein